MGNTGHGETFLFWVGSIVSVLGALGLIFSKKIVHAALCLCSVMLCLAFFYMAQGAVFLGVVQIVVYTGAVMMLFLFVLMLIGIESQDSLTESIRGQRWLAVPFVLGFGAVLLGVYAHANLPAFVGTDAANAHGGGNVQSLAEVLFSRYYWAFEVSSAVLITSAVGAMVLTHRERVFPRKSQRELSVERFERWGRGEKIQVTGLPNPGVYAQHNAVDTPALLPDGTPSEASVNATLRGRDTVRGFRPLPLPGQKHTATNGAGSGGAARAHGEGAENQEVSQ